MNLVGVYLYRFNDRVAIEIRGDNGGQFFAYSQTTRRSSNRLGV